MTETEMLALRLHERLLNERIEELQKERRLLLRKMRREIRRQKKENQK